MISFVGGFPKTVARLLCVLVLGSIGCDADSASDDDREPADFGHTARATAAKLSTQAGPCADCCADGFSRGPGTQALSRLAAFTPSPADVAVCPNGDVFVTLDGLDQVWRVPAEAQAGAPTLYADLSGVQPAGIACDDRGRLYVAAFALRDGSRYDRPGILLIDGELSEPRLLSNVDSLLGWLTPNGVAAADGVGVYASDTLAGTIVLLKEKNGCFLSRVVASNQLGVNGLAFDPAARKLYATNSLTQAVVSFAVGSDGALSRRRRVWTGPLGAMLDEVEVDERGELYVAAYGQGRVYHLPDESVIAGVASPASLAFRGGRLLIVDYHLNEPTREGGLYAADLGVCGAL
jgi:DNA-binding beta-propeller fold protein YncE